MTNKTVQVIFICLILIVGVFARFTDLSWHFVHPDDIGVAQTIFGYEHDNRDARFSVSSHWTYSPFQFLITPSLISMDQDYRTLLFWGRLPSCLFGILGLLVLLLVYRQYDDHNMAKAILALALAACSWENIIMAKQMHNYALGVSAAFGVVWLLLYLLKKENPYFLIMLLSGLLLAIFCSMQYSILFFLPAFFITMFIYGLKHAQRKVNYVIKLISSSLICVAGVFPLWYFFLRKLADAGTTLWARGPSNQYLFSFPSDAGVWEKLIYAVMFYFKNFALLVRTHTAFVPENHVLYTVVSYLFLGLFIFGLVSYIRTNNVQKKYLGLFWSIAVLTWCTLVAMQKLTLSPTRHTLIFLPLIVMAIADGFFYIFERTKQLKAASNGALIVALMVVIAFGMFFRNFLESRKDPFIEQEIISTLEKYGVDAVLPVLWAPHLEAMKSVRDYYGFFEKGFVQDGLISNGAPTYRTMAWISQRQGLNNQNYERYRKGLNQFLFLSNRARQRRGGEALPFLKYPLSYYNVIYSQENPSEVEVDFSRKTTNGSNGFYFYILKLKGT